MVVVALPATPSYEVTLLPNVPGVAHETASLNEDGTFALRGSLDDNLRHSRCLEFGPGTVKLMETEPNFELGRRTQGGVYLGYDSGRTSAIFWPPRQGGKFERKSFPTPPGLTSISVRDAGPNGTYYATGQQGQYISKLYNVTWPDSLSSPITRYAPNYHGQANSRGQLPIAEVDYDTGYEEHATVVLGSSKFRIRVSGLLLSARGISENGVVCGRATQDEYTDSIVEAFVWDEANGARFLARPHPYFRAYANDVNDLGTIVGNVYVYSPARRDAAVWENGVIHKFADISDVAAKGIAFPWLYAVTNRAEILGSGTVGNDERFFIARLR